MEAPEQAFSVGRNVLVRLESEGDYERVRAINESAFEGAAEANLVDALRERAAPIVSLVAEDDGNVVGHIMFSPVTIADHRGLKVMGLAPMAVEPSCQRKGIGSMLVQAGLQNCREIGADAIVVLGYPEYYTRFGFAPAIDFGISSEYEVPDDVFMALELKSGALADINGTAKYHAAFREV